VTVAELLALAAARLATVVADTSPRREAQFLLARALAVPESWLLAHGDAPVAEGAAAEFLAWVQRRARGEPAHYIVGSCPFWGREFAVSPAALLPRPETELLLERALALAPHRQPRILDVGTGTGCLAATLALERPGAFVVATDASAEALALARHNVRRWGAAVHLACGDLAHHLQGGWQVVVANLPYLPSATLAQLPLEIRHFEPRLALDGGETGTQVVRALVEDLPRLLAPAGCALLELGQGQAEEVAQHARSRGLEELERIVDLGGVERVLVLQRQQEGPAPSNSGATG